MESDNDSKTFTQTPTPTILSQQSAGRLSKVVLSCIHNIAYEIDANFSPFYSELQKTANSLGGRAENRQRGDHPEDGHWQLLS